MPFSSCESVIDRLSTIVDGEASLSMRVRFQMHIAMCGNCRRYYRQYKAVSAAAQLVTPEDLPGDFDRVLGPVLDEIGLKKTRLAPAADERRLPTGEGASLAERSGRLQTDR